jgi:GABA permease
VLSILTSVGIVAVLVQMAFDHKARSQLWLSLLSWAVVVGLYFVVGRRATSSRARRS